MLKTVFLSLLALCATLSTRSIDGATAAYWRFETGPAGANVIHTGADGVFHGTTPDLSGNGNTLSAWTQGGYAGFAYRTNTPFRNVPQSGATNLFSVKNTGAYPAMFTSAAGSSPTGINAQTITPAQFTIEASYKPEANGGYRTIVGRDARNVSTANSQLAALYLQVRPDDSVGISFTDVSGYTHSAFSPPGWIYGFNFATNPEGTNGLWYNLAATSDGSKLRMYVNNLLVATTDLAASGSPNRALAKGATSGANYNAGAWSVGRGLYNGEHTDRAYGFIDEVRISDTALPMGEFLAALRPELNIRFDAGNANAITFDIARGESGAVASILQASDPSLPLVQWTTVTTRTLNTNGAASATIQIDPTASQRFYQLRVAPKPIPAGSLRYTLAGGNENWPANIREQIIYAMDGAVAQYNRWGTFNKTLTANYNPGVPTAQASYSGWIDFGGQIGYRTALHEIAHTLGVGTAPNYGNFVSNGLWTGSNAIQQLRAFDGPTANLNTDGTHIWPYGLNFDNEGGTENNRRHVFIVAAMRRDMGIQ
jgi:hypothetical protein